MPKEEISPVLLRLIEEVRQEQEEFSEGKPPINYDRAHNRHNRSGGYNRVHNRHNR